MGTMTVYDKTYMIFRCTKQKYADSFVNKGTMRFGKPNEWIAAYYREGKGRGDHLEGVFAAFENKDEKWINFCKQSRQDASVIYDKEHKMYFLQSKSVINTRAFCVFGVQDSSFTKMEEAENHELYPTMTINDSYFRAFSDVSKEEYEKMNDEEKPVLLMINNPHEFFERIRAGLKSTYGLKEEEIWILPVLYKDFSKPFLIPTPAPTELLTKSDEFKYQSEIRVVLNTKRKDILEDLEKNNGIVHIGSLKDICDIEPYYFSEMLLCRRGNQMFFNRSIPIKTTIDKDGAIAILCQLLCDEYPGLSIRGKEKEERLNGIIKMLEEKFGMKYNRKNYELYYQDENGVHHTYMMKETAFGKIRHHIDLFVERKEWNKARDSCLNALEIKSDDKWVQEMLSKCEARIKA